MLIKYEGRESKREVLLVMVVSASSVFVPGYRPVDFLAVTAVLLTFVCIQSSFDINEELLAKRATDKKIAIAILSCSW